MPNKLVSIRKRSDFEKNRKEGVAYQTPFFVLRVMDWDKDEIAVGYVVSKKGIDKRAVVRNRVKRRLREIARAILGDYAVPGKAYVFYAKKPAFDAAFKEMKSALKSLIQKCAELA